MRKLTKGIIASTMVASLVSAMVIGINTKIYAAEVKNDNQTQLNVDSSKEENGYKVYKGYYNSDEGKKFDIFYSDGFFSKDSTDFNQHMATLASQLVHSSSTYIVNKDYSNGAKNLTDALNSIGFKNTYVSDSYKNKPTSDSIACVIASKELEKKDNMKYDYAIDITIRSASYEAEWASNVTLGKTGEAKGFSNSANTVINTYLNQYFEQNPKLKEYALNGKLAFFVNGYSRGGATANIIAKKLIDEYQPKGSAVYAYTIEAPQGGIKSDELKDRNYDGIHNIINPNDLVCYVAPTEMGFKRYGVDHYIAGVEIKDQKYIEKNMYFNVKSDNLFSDKVYDEKRIKVIEELKKMLNTNDVSRYHPYEIQNKQFDLRHAKIKDVNGQTTASFLNNFINNFVKYMGKTKIDRGTYSDKLEQPIRNIMTVLNSDNDLFKLENFTNQIEIFKALTKTVLSFAAHIKVYSRSNNIFKTTWDFLTGSDNLIYTIDFTDSMRKTIADNIKNVLNNQPKLVELLNKQYPTKAQGALNDIHTLLYEVLKTGNQLDDLITFGANVQGIFKNHAALQVSAWLRIDDTWYNNK